MEIMMYIRDVNLAALDLNLLVALDALLAESSVGRAALRLGLSQPAVSHALRRLRVVLSDPLLVRVGAQMHLTARARGLRVPLAAALEQVRALFASEPFDPEKSAQRFRLMMPDLVVDLLLPPLLSRMAKLAPHIRLDVTAWRGPATMDSEYARSIDLAFTCTRERFGGFYRQRLYTDRDALAVRRGHPLAPRLHQLETFLRARHVAVIGAGECEDMIDAWLRDRNIERAIALGVPSYLQALHIAAASDLVAFVPTRLIRMLARPLSLRLIAPPLDPGLDAQFMFHPARAHLDPASIWLRRLIAEISPGDP
jgi:DNA-binding transcriptional LysR family regulator